jgi:hypothetical protein
MNRLNRWQELFYFDRLVVRITDSHHWGVGSIKVSRIMNRLNQWQELLYFD